MKITYLGHATLSIEFGGKQLLVDPFISGNPLAETVEIAALHPDYILLTHGHQDHVLDVETIAQQSGATLISNFEMVSYYEAKGLKGHPMNLGGKYTFDFGVVKSVIAHHSSVLPDGTYAGNPGGFVLWNEHACLYIAGDTALTEEMKLIPKTCPQLTAAVLPVGDNFTMGYEDALIAADYIECDTIIGYHFDTFPPIAIDHTAAKAYFEKAGKTLILPQIGETIT